jgi:hypothetical protein
MKMNLNALRIVFLCVFAAGIFASCSRQTAYNGLHSNQLQAQQIPSTVNAEPETALQNTTILQQPVNENVGIDAPAAQTKTLLAKQKTTKFNAVKSKIVASTTKKALKSTVQKNVSFAMHTAKMGAKADPNDGLATIGAIFLVLGILSFVIPPLFFIGLTASAAQLLVAVAIGITIVGLLLLATGLARKAEK